MPDDKDKPTEPVVTTAAETFNVDRDQPAPQPGMSLSPGLVHLEDSPVPNADRSHVVGPQQSAVDPVLAGLDTQHNPMTRAEARVITRSDGEMVVPLPDTKSDAIVGPAGVSAPAALNAQAEAAKATPSVGLATTQPPKTEPATPAPPAPPAPTPIPAAKTESAASKT